LLRFNNQVQRQYGRKWCKRWLGYYEKPGALRRKQKKMDKLNRGAGILKLHIELQEPFWRTGPTLAAEK
jgi:hypothetical protein